MDWILSLAPLLKICAAFAAMLLGIRLKLGLGWSILAGGAILALLFGMGPVAWAKASYAALTYDKTLYLAGIVSLILVLSDVMDSSGQAKRLMEAMRPLLKKPRVALIFFPALIGLLPMPGGAVFSAPMVKNVADPMELKAVDKVVINYWFRHIWEFCWPLYPGLLLTASLSNITLGKLLLLASPGTIMCVLLGWVFLLRPGVLQIPPSWNRDQGNGQGPGKAIRQSLWLGLPLLVAIAGSVGLELAMEAFFPDIPFELGVVIALGAALCCAFVQNRMGLKYLLRFLGRKHLYSMMLVILAVFIFKDILERAGAIEQMAHLLGGSAALLSTVMVLPFLAGMVGGISIAFVAATFPLFLGLIQQLGLQDHTAAYVILGWFSGFSGVLASPMHICFILSCQYFNVDMMRAWRRVIIPCMILLAFGIGYFFVLK